MLVGGGDHDHVGPFGGFLVRKHLEARGLGLFGGRRAGAERDRDFTHDAVAPVLRMGVALAAVADDGDPLALDQILVGVAIVINLHWISPSWIWLIVIPAKAGMSPLRHASTARARPSPG